MAKAVVNDTLDRRIKKALLFIDTAVAHLKSVALNNPSSSVGIEAALAWLDDAKKELNTILDEALKNTIVFIDVNDATKIARRARTTVKDAVEVLVRKCIDEYMSERG
jgi:hypothetical protein